MGKGRHHRTDRQQRFEDMSYTPQQDAASFFFDLRLMLPPGMTAHDVQMARQAVEHRLQKVLRKKDRILWTADGFFVSIGTGHPARAAAAAERIHQDICELLAGKTLADAHREPELCESEPRPRLRADASPYAHPRAPHT
jgi:hypothetical protein